MCFKKWSKVMAKSYSKGWIRKTSLLLFLMGETRGGEREGRSRGNGRSPAGHLLLTEPICWAAAGVPGSRPPGAHSWICACVCESACAHACTLAHTRTDSANVVLSQRLTALKLWIWPILFPRPASMSSFGLLKKTLADIYLFSGGNKIFLYRFGFKMDFDKTLCILVSSLFIVWKWCLFISY